jgi:ribosomal protein S24E
VAAFDLDQPPPTPESTSNICFSQAQNELTKRRNIVCEVYHVQPYPQEVTHMVLLALLADK